jgi:hypothetical protein
MDQITKEKKRKKKSSIGILLLHSQNQLTHLYANNGLLGQLGEKYFDYFVCNIIDYSVNCGLSRSGARRRTLAQTIGNTRGLDINSPGVQKITLKTCDFIDISNTTIPTALGGSTTASPLILIMIQRQQLDYAALTAPHPIKAKFFSSKSRFLFRHTRHSGGSAMRNHLAYH